MVWRYRQLQVPSRCLQQRRHLRLGRGFTGKGQFWFAIQAEGADRGAEMDREPSSAPDAQPYSTPVYNATFIGAGAEGGSQVMKFRENTGGIHANSIFTGFEKGVDVDTGGKDGATIASGQDSEARFTAGDLALKAKHLPRYRRCLRHRWYRCHWR